MKTLYIKDLEKSMVIVNETFAIYEVEKAEDKNSKPFYKLLLGDKTGKLQAKIWNDKLTVIDTKILKLGNIVKISGKVEEYQGKYQINIIELSGIDETALEIYLESSEFDAEEMMMELKNEIKEIKNIELQKVLNNIFNDNNLVNKFKYWTAAKSIHHDFRSGLLQHILEMLSISKGLKRFYTNVNFDILTAGIVLHDIGKVEELESNGIGTSYSKKGSLIGHIVLGVMIFEKYGGKDLPEDLYLHVSHLILSHHGNHEFGSPVVPSTVEAIMLNKIDDLSSKARTAVKAIKEITQDKDFGNYNPWLENARMWKGGIYQEKEDVNLEKNLLASENKIPDKYKAENKNLIEETSIQLNLED